MRRPGGLPSGRCYRSLRRQVAAAAVAAAAVGAVLLAAFWLDAHDLPAARAVLHRAEADVDRSAGREVVLRPAEPHQLRGRAALERPGRGLALVVGDVEMQPDVRVDELELL